MILFKCYQSNYIRFKNINFIVNSIIKNHYYLILNLRFLIFYN